jgi:hypothetical protein
MTVGRMRELRPVASEGSGLEPLDPAGTGASRSSASSGLSS